MKKWLLLFTLAIALIVTQSASAATITLNFASDTNRWINFGQFGQQTLGQFSFSPDAFKIRTAESNPGGLVDGSANGLVGDIAGTFTIDGCASGCTSTTVSGIGDLTIRDGSNPSLTAKVDWKNISQAINFSQLQEGLNLGNQINLTSISYAGSNHDLRAFADMASSGFINLNWTVTDTSKTIQYWATHTDSVGSFSGLMQVTPEPGFYGILAAGFSGLFFLSRRKRT